MSSNEKTTTPYRELGMNWYRALIYAVLFLIAAFFASEGLFYVSGNVYISSGLSWEQVNAYYAAHSGLKALDITYGVLSILVAIALMLTRHLLYRFHHLAPIMLLIVPIVGGVCSIGYTFAAYALIHASLMEAVPFSATMFVLVAAFTIVNRIYIQKRDDLFYN